MRRNPDGVYCLLPVQFAVLCVRRMGSARRKIAALETKKPEDAAARTAVDDALSRDIAALLAYTGPAEKEKTDADS